MDKQTTNKDKISTECKPKLDYKQKLTVNKSEISSEREIHKVDCR